MKERPLQKVEGGCGAASAALRCAGLRSATAALSGITVAVYAMGRSAEGHSQIVWRMAFYLEGKDNR